MSFSAIDASGRRVTLALPPRRIVSLVPSLTELCFALGAGDRVVGVTRFCEQPPDARRLARIVGGTKDPRIDRVLALDPDLVIVSLEENRKEDVEAIETAGVVTWRTLLEDVPASVALVRQLGRALAAEAPADALAAAIADALATPPPAPPVRYFCPIWRHPYMIAATDTYMSDILARAGGEGVLARPSGGGPHYFEVSLADVAAAAPAVVLLPSEPYPFAPKHLPEIEDSLGDTPAWRAGHVHLIDGKDVAWYGPRTPAALARLRSIFAALRPA